VYANYFMLDNARRHNINNISEGSLSNLILKTFFTFQHVDFIFSVIVYEHLSVMEDDVELNKPTFLAKIIILVSYNGKL
jgi:hypothetical protein